MILVARIVPVLPSCHPRLLESVVIACIVAVTLPDVVPLATVFLAPVSLVVGSRLQASGGGQIP